MKTCSDKDHPEVTLEENAPPADRTRLSERDLRFKAAAPNNTYQDTLKAAQKLALK